VFTSLWKNETDLFKKHSKISLNKSTHFYVGNVSITQIDQKDSKNKFQSWILFLIDFHYASFSIKECANHNWMNLFHNFSAINLWCKEEFVNGHYCRTMCPTQKWRTQWGQCVLRLKNEGHNEDIVCENHRRSCAVGQSGKYFLLKLLSRFSFHFNLRNKNWFTSKEREIIVPNLHEKK